MKEKNEIESKLTIYFEEPFWVGVFEELSVDLSRYKHITICSPIRVNTLSSPIRAFCQSAKGKIKEADLITVHYQNARYRNVLTEAEKLLGVRMTEYRSYRCRMGKVKKIG